MLDVARIRQDFPITRENRIYLDNASVAPFPTQVVEAATMFYQRQSQGGVDAYYWGLSELLDEARSLCARLVNAEPDEISFIENTGSGISIFANMLDWAQGDNVVITDLEFFPYQWTRLKRFGVDVRIVPSLKPDGTRDVTLNDLRSHCDHRTRVIALSQVSFFNGLKYDLGAVGRLAKEFGAYLVVDAIQSVGAMRWDVRQGPVDALSCGGFKWLLGPIGTGFFFCRRELIQRYEPAKVGWHSHKKPFSSHLRAEYEPAPNANRFMPGGINLAGLCGMAAGIKYLLDIGIEKIEKRNMSLADRVVEGISQIGLPFLSPLRREARSHIVNFIPTNCEATLQQLAQAGITLLQRAEGVRVAPNFYNEEWEIDRLIEIVHKVEQQRE